MAKIFLSLLFLFFSCQNSQIDKETLPNTANAFSDEITEVDVYKTKLSDFNYIINCNGRIKPTIKQKVIATVSGFISSCDIKNNDVVDAGKVLIRFDTQDLDIRLKKAEENLFNSRLNYKSDLLSQESLLLGKRKGIVDTVHRRLKASSGLSEAELELEEILNEKERTIIEAPFNGKIANININKGTYVKAGDELFTVYTDEDLFLEATILEEDVRLVKNGLRAEIFPIATNDKYEASVSGINPIVDENGMVSIKLNIINETGLMPGMNASATIYISYPNSLTVPKEAIVMRDGKPVVFTYKDGYAKWNYVKLGKDNGKMAVIKEGFNVGQTVIISNNIQLSHDTPVKLEEINSIISLKH